MLLELDIHNKLLTITGDNASNNEAMVSLLHDLLPNNSQFHGISSFIRCLAHILNLIVKDILSTLHSGTSKQALKICDHMKSWNEDLLAKTETPLSRLRILAIWISRSSQRQQEWKHVCAFMKLSDRFIPQDIVTRWNSTYLMLDMAVHAKVQINRYIHEQSDLPRFSEDDWRRLSQLHRVLAPFYELTLLVSKKKPQISMAIPIYYELHDLLNQETQKKGIFKDLDDDIMNAIHHGLIKYQKYYTFMDNTDAYYTALILDPRVKGDLLLHELSDNEAGQMIVNTIRENIHEQYSYEAVDTQTSSTNTILLHKHQDNIEARMLQRLTPIVQKPAGSDIDDYFTSSRVPLDTSHPEWLFRWWNTNRDSMPQMAAAARDYLAIPASEVDVERLFSGARDLLGLRRYAMTADTMRMLMLMDDIM
jgi:hypothetical protein